jgi:hypothetical protein
MYTAIMSLHIIMIITIASVSSLKPLSGLLRASKPLSGIIKYVLGVCCLSFGSQYIAVGIATGYGLGGRGVGVRVPTEAKFLYSPRRPDRF